MADPIPSIDGSKSTKSTIVKKPVASAAPAATPTTTPPAGSSGLTSTLTKFFGADGAAQIAAAAAQAGATSGSTSSTPKKSGTYTRTYESSTVPDPVAIEDSINKIFNNLYGRDANRQELDTYLPKALAMYKDKNGQSKSTYVETYNNGVLTDTKVNGVNGTDVTGVLEDTIKAQLASGKVAIDKSGIPEGPMGKTFVTLKQMAYENGIQLSDSAALDYANKVGANQMDINTALDNIRTSAASAFPQFTDQIKAGTNLKTLADPYIQSMSNILEIPSSSIDLFDPTVRGALSYTGADGKPATKSLYDFEQTLRNDPRWNYTSNARKSLDSVGLQVLRNFGLAN
jgi:hypothetical protein